MSFTTWDQLKKDQKKTYFDSIRHIFFISSKRQSFESEAARERFWQLWCGQYLDFYPEQFFLMMDEQGQLLAYLSGCENTQAQLQQFVLPGQELFYDCYEQFPAHLHINADPKARGQGAGSKLMQHYLQQLRMKGIAGVHLITSDGERNVGFYQRNGFNTSCLKKRGEAPLLLLGQSL